MDWKETIISYVKHHPLVIIKFDKEDSESIGDSRHGPNKFSFTREHALLENVKAYSICLFYFKGAACRIGIVRSKSAVSTLTSRVSITNGMKILPDSIKGLLKLLTENRYKNLFEDKINHQVAVLSPKLSGHIVSSLLTIQNNHDALEAIIAAANKYGHLPNTTRMQMSAIQMAIKAFGLSQSETPLSIKTKSNADTAIRYLNTENRLMEEKVIAHDARSIPGFELVESQLTGCTIFESTRRSGEHEKLEVYTAHSGDLEKLLGVDLIYINATRKNLVMVQYKMLDNRIKENETDGTNWIYRPDKQFYKEKNRMVLLKKNAKKNNDYRLNSEPFYFKFVKRIQAEKAVEGFILPLEHLNEVLKNPLAEGPNGGIRIGFEILEGRYLRETEFLCLIRSGYIGTHSDDTSHLSTLIKEVSRGNNAIVLAWQHKV